MDAKKLLGSTKQNIGIIIAAAFLAFGLFYISKNPDLFLASVLSVQEKQYIVQKGRDIAYKTNSWAVDIFMSQKLATPARIDFTISFDKDKITIDPQQLSGQGTFTITNQNENEIRLQSSALENVDKGQSLLILPFTGEIKDILLSESTATLIDGTQKSLSIGTLNEITSHSK